ncbi:MAG: hypothetical protein ACKPFF_22225, partial [Planktothrix sp.]
GDFFGTGRIAAIDRAFRAFEETKVYVQSLGIKTKAEWFEYSKSGNRPEDIPAQHDRTYNDKGWKSWPDFLGTLGNGNVWRKKTFLGYINDIIPFIHTCTIPQLITIIRTNNLQNHFDKEFLK